MNSMQMKMFDCGPSVLIIFKAGTPTPVFRIRVSKERLKRLNTEIEDLLDDGVKAA